LKKAAETKKILNAIIDIHNRPTLSDQGAGFVSLVAQCLPVPLVRLYSLDTTGTTYRLLAATGDGNYSDDSCHEIDVAHPNVKRLFRSGARQFQTNDSGGLFHSFLPTEFTNGSRELKRVLAVPLRVDRHNTGILIIADSRTSEFTQEEINTVTNISRRIVPGLEKSYLHERTADRERDVTVLHSCCSIISSSHDYPAVFEDFAIELGAIVDIDWASLMIIEDEVITVLASYSTTDTSWKPGESMLLEGTATESVKSTGTALMEPDLERESLFVGDVYHLNEGIRSVICAPICAGDGVIGSLIVGSRKPDAFCQRQVEFLSRLARQISFPIKSTRLYMKALQESNYDKLTGLFNRRSMDEHIAGEVNRHSRYGGVFTLILFDLDAMKHINDHFGHLAGDGILARTGKVIKEVIRNVDKAFRYGGDEFALILPNTVSNAAVQVSERVRKELSEQLIVDDMTVTASFGLASWPADGVEPDELIAAADGALYEAKNRGGNRSCSAHESRCRFF
jgi:diguanylate cyclase (GGDEF)-like protein